jgi:hypothetical protein
VTKFGLPSEEVELGLRRSGARPLQDEENHPCYSYEAVWQYVHRYLNDGHFAAWEHETERVDASDMTDSLISEITACWPDPAHPGLERILKSANGSHNVFFMLHRILRIDPECPACGRFPWIVGYDGRLSRAGAVLSIYVCPGCGYLFLKR